MSWIGALKVWAIISGSVIMGAAIIIIALWIADKYM